MTPSAEAPVLVIGRQGQVASAMQRQLVMAGRPELDLAAPTSPNRWRPYCGISNPPW